MIGRRNWLRWATAVAAGGVTAIVTYYAILAGHESGSAALAKGGPLFAGDEDPDVGEWDVRWIQ